jgi:hypothetical protein
VIVEYLRQYLLKTIIYFSKKKKKTYTFFVVVEVELMGCLLIFRADDCHCFQVFINHTVVIARRILKYAQMSLRTVLHVEGMYFAECKNETKLKDDIWLLIISMNRSKFSSFYYF